MRELVNAIFYVQRAGIAWHVLPPCFPPRQTVYGWFAAWRDAGLWQSIAHHLIMQDRERAGREAFPSAAVIDSQSVKTIEAGGPRGYDAGKKVLGRKRHAMVDTDGRLLSLGGIGHALAGVGGIGKGQFDEREAAARPDQGEQ